MTRLALFAVLILALLDVPQTLALLRITGRSFLNYPRLSESSSKQRIAYGERDIDVYNDNGAMITRVRFREELAKYSLSRALGLISTGMTGKVIVPPQFVFPHCAARSALFGPTVNRYLIANPQTFLNDENLLAAFNIDVRTVEKDFNDAGGDLSVLAKYLPVIYVANVHSEFGWLGFQLNLFTVGETVESLFPYLPHLRGQPLYRGGARRDGSAWYMLHRRKDFPENRAFKKLPKSECVKYPTLENDAFDIFYSPSVAFANELCRTGDAIASEFKFFAWSTIWKPGQLESEVKDRKWIVIDGPVDILFHQDPNGDSPPLYRRILASLPKKKHR